MDLDDADERHAWTETGIAWPRTPPREGGGGGGGAGGGGDFASAPNSPLRHSGQKQKQRSWEDGEEDSSAAASFPSPALSASAGGRRGYQRLRRSARRIEMTRAPSPLGMQYALDESEEEQHTQALAFLEGNRRFLESNFGARHSFAQAEGDMLYRMFFHYNDYDMDRELDAAIDFVLAKYALGALVDGEMYPPLILHPDEALAAQAQPDSTLTLDAYGWPPERGHPIPSSIRQVTERQLFQDRRDRWFVRDTFQRVRQLPKQYTLYRRFLLIVLVAMEPELFERVAAHCPPSMIDGHENEQGMTLQQVMEKLTKELVTQFNQFTAVATVRGYMTRIINTYDMGGVIR